MARLLTVEASLVSENQNLGNTIRTLAGILADHGVHVELPRTDINEPEASNLSGVSPTDASCHARDQSHPQPCPTPLRQDGRLSWPDFSQVDRSASWQHQTPTFAAFDFPTIPTTSCHWRLRLGDLDPITVGMEFVLAYVSPASCEIEEPLRRHSRLEEPCLNHIHGDPEKPDHPNGHALTISSQVLSISPSSSQSPASEALKEACANAPASILQRLLALATNLAIEGEVTPVQAWNRIRHQPQFDQFDADGLMVLTKKLSQTVKCHG